MTLKASGRAKLTAPVSGTPLASQEVPLATWRANDGAPKHVTIQTNGVCPNVVNADIDYWRSVAMFECRVTFGGQTQIVQLDGQGRNALSVVAESVDVFAVWDARAIARLAAVNAIEGIEIQGGQYTTTDMAAAIVEGSVDRVAQRTDFWAPDLEDGSTVLVAPWAPLAIAPLLPSPYAGTVRCDCYANDTPLSRITIGNPLGAFWPVPPATTKIVALPSDSSNLPIVGFVWLYGLPITIPAVY